MHELMLCLQIIVGTIASRAPSSTMGPAAQLEVDLALNIFRNCATTSPRAKYGLVGYGSISMRVLLNDSNIGCFDAVENKGSTSTKAIIYGQDCCTTTREWGR